MEGDILLMQLRMLLRDFNPLPPHGGRLLPRCHQVRSTSDFNPLPPHGGRLTISSVWSVLRNFNPLPPHGGRPKRSRCRLGESLYFNPLPPHGGRPIVIDDAQYLMAFQSTPSAWRETGADSEPGCVWYISIHSLRMEGDHVIFPW